jgi:hypothetical protein
VAERACFRCHTSPRPRRRRIVRVRLQSCKVTYYRYLGFNFLFFRDNMSTNSLSFRGPAWPQMPAGTPGPSLPTGQSWPSRPGCLACRPVISLLGHGRPQLSGLLGILEAALEKNMLSLSSCGPPASFEKEMQKE